MPKPKGHGRALENSIETLLKNGQRFTLATSDPDSWYQKMVKQYPDAVVTKDERHVYIEGKK